MHRRFACGPTISAICIRFSSDARGAGRQVQARSGGLASSQIHRSQCSQDLRSAGGFSLSLSFSLSFCLNSRREGFSLILLAVPPISLTTFLAWSSIDENLRISFG